MIIWNNVTSGSFPTSGSGGVILSGFSGWCYCSDREKPRNLQQEPKLTNWKAHSLISWRSAEHVWVNLGEVWVSMCVATHCTEVCWSKRGGVGMFRNETTTDHMTSLVWSLLFFFPPQSYDCLLYKCPCLRAFEADCHPRWTGHKGLHYD